MILQKTKFAELVMDIEKIDRSIWDFYRESKIFISSSNFVSRNENILESIEKVKKASTSIRSLINLTFMKMNPSANSLIAYDNKESDNKNYANLSLKIEKLLDSISQEASNFFSGLSNKNEIITNAITNKAKLDSFISFLSGVYTDLLFNSIYFATKDYLSLKEPAILDVKGEVILLNTLTKNQEVFWYLVYRHFSRLSQITISLVKFTQKEIAIKTTPVVDATDFYIGSLSKKKTETEENKGEEEKQETETEEIELVNQDGGEEDE